MKKSCWPIILLVLLLGMAPAPVMADIVVLSDDFNSEGTPGPNYASFAQWDVTNGTVDLLGPGYFNFFPAYGKYVDLDGSSGNAGRMESKSTFSLNTGVTYTLMFDLAGSQRGDTNTVTVSLGSFSESFTLASSVAFTTYTRNISVASPTSAKLIFDHAGGDNVGLLLDNVQLSYVPLPGAVWLLGSGLVGLAGARRLRKK